MSIFLTSHHSIHIIRTTRMWKFDFGIYAYPSSSRDRAAIPSDIARSNSLVVIAGPGQTKLRVIWSVAPAH